MTGRFVPFHLSGRRNAFVVASVAVGGEAIKCAAHVRSSVLTLIAGISFLRTAPFG